MEKYAQKIDIWSIQDNFGQMSGKEFKFPEGIISSFIP
jgi:hypothetical protein